MAVHQTHDYYPESIVEVPIVSSDIWISMCDWCHNKNMKWYTTEFGNKFCFKHREDGILFKLVWL